MNEKALKKVIAVLAAALAVTSSSTVLLLNLNYSKKNTVKYTETEETTEATTEVTIPEFFDCYSYERDNSPDALNIIEGKVIWYKTDSNGNCHKYYGMPDELKEDIYNANK